MYLGICEAQVPLEATSSWREEGGNGGVEGGSILRVGKVEDGRVAEQLHAPIRYFPSEQDVSLE